MDLLFPSKSSGFDDDQGPGLSRGVEGIYRSRHYSSHNYLKIDKGKSWFWGDSRAEALDLATVNGLEVGRHDKSRDPKTWRKTIKLMEGSAGLEDKLALRKASRNERPLRRGSGSTPLTSSWLAINVPEEQDEELEELPEVRKRSHSMLKKNAGASMDVDMDVDMDDEAAADQFIDELAGDVGLAQSDEEPAESDDGDAIEEAEAVGISA